MQEVVLLLDEDRARRRLVGFGLRCADFAVVESASIVDARQQVKRHRPDLMLLIAPRLDVRLRAMLPAVEGGPAQIPVPALVVLERGAATDIDRFSGAGITCLIGSPAPHLLIAQIHAMLDKRASAWSAAGESAGLWFDVEGGILRRGTSTVALGPKERRVLQLLLEHADQVIPKQQLLYRIWGARGDQLGRVVDVSICRLRRALRLLDCADRLQTIRAAGYRFTTARAARPRVASGHDSAISITAPTGVHQ